MSSPNFEAIIQKIISASLGILLILAGAYMVIKLAQSLIAQYADGLFLFGNGGTP